MAEFQLKALIIAVDKLSPTLRVMNRNLKVFHSQLMTVGKGAPMFSAGFAAALAVPAKAFAGLESSAVNLQNVLMDKNGNIPKVFEAINAEAIKLGNQLPGSTEDMNRMASSLKSLGVSGDSIANGVLRSSAYLAVVGKEIGVTYDTAAESVGKLGKGFRIADQDMVSFTDSLQRSMFSGSKLEELHFAMSKVSGELEVWGKQGLKVADATLPLVSIFTSRGFSGEEAGTGLRSIIHEAGKAGKLKNIESMVGVLDKINHLPDKIRSAKLEQLFGREQAGKAALITLENYHRQVEAMANQGSLMDKIANSAGTLENKVESAGGTWTNFMASFGKAYSPQLKALADQVNSVSEAMGGFALKNGEGILTAVKMVGALGALKLGAYGLAAGVRLLSGAMKLGPWGLFAQALFVAAPLIIDNFDKIKASVEGLTGSMVSLLKQINDNETLKAIGSVPLYFGRSIGELLPNLPDLSAPVGEGMRPPGFQKQSLLGGGRGAVDVRVSFDNSPAGMRVAPVQTSGIAHASSMNVGYRSFPNTYGI